MVGALSFLIVDDDMFVGRALAAVLKRYGTSSTAGSIEAAVRQMAQTWDGLLIDVRLGEV